VPFIVVEDYAAAVCDISAVVLEKQQLLLAQGELGIPLPQPNACELPTSWKRKITELEAAIPEEREAKVRR
jgi:hypothetical protein